MNQRNVMLLLFAYGWGTSCCKSVTDNIIESDDSHKQWTKQGPTGPGNSPGKDGVENKEPRTAYPYCVQGPPGIPGVPGSHGQNGIPGSPGVPGSPSGQKGQKGEAGVTGSRGHHGPKGDRGPTGPTGLNGRVGPKGEPGEPATFTKVAFSVMCSKDIGPNSTHTDIRFDRIITNVGSGFNPKTSRFVATVRGIYVFFASLMGKNKSFTVYLLHNGSYKARIYGSRVGCDCYHYPAATNQIILRLEAGDEVWLQLMTGDAITGSGTGSMSTFHGYILWED